LVSAVICTRDRPRLLQQTVDSVLAQRLAPAELIIVDDGSDPPALKPDSPSVPVRIIRLGGAGPGAARAAGLAAARHQLIAFCDDDDVWFDDHLEALVAHIQAEPEVALVYADAQWWEDGVGSEVPFSLDYDAELLREGPNFILPSTAICRVAALRAAGGFDCSLPAFEDWDLWLRLSLDHPIRHLRRVLGAVRFSADGVAVARASWREWTRIHRRHRRRVERAGPEAEHNLRRRAGPPPRFDPRTWSGGRRELLWHSTMRPNMSFSVVSRYLIEALDREGVQVRIAPTLNQPAPGLERFYHPDDGRGRFAFYYDWRCQPRVLPPPRVMRTVWESTRVPPAQIATINRDVELIWVPSACTREIYLDCGVQVPVKLLPNGVDGERFPLLERDEDRETITFGTLAELSPRKGTDVLLAAFMAEFSAKDPVRLLISATHGPGAYACEDPRISWREGLLSHGPPLLEFLRELDVFVLPSRAEPWGLPGLEAMATGAPLIATRWGGPAEYMDPADSLPLDYQLVDCGGVVSNNRRYEGRWAEPDREHLQALMRWCLHHREEVRAMGRRAAARVRRDFTWERPARMLKHDLDELALARAG
jgi:glycosyltransferase involved in cell wall biosynthesis